MSASRFFLTLFLGLSLCSSLYANQGEKSIRQSVERDWGKILDRSETPAIYSEIDQAFNRLSTAQAEFSGGIVSLNRVHVIDSPLVNAFVYQQKKEAVDQSTNLVFITTGLMHKLHQGSPGQGSEKVKNAFIRSLGVLAHELAHPLDKYDYKSLAHRLGSSQAREFRADAEGAQLLEKAGYPREGVYQGLQIILEDNHQRDMFADAISSHPNPSLRKSFQRFFLTLKRYFTGSPQPDYPKAILPGYLSELRQRTLYGHWSFKEPSSTSEAIKRLHRFNNKSLTYRHKNYEKLEFNRLLIWLGQNASHQEGEEVASFMKKLVDQGNNFPQVAGKLDLKWLGRFEKGMAKPFLFDANQELKVPTHHQNLAVSQVYTSPSYRMNVDHFLDFSQIKHWDSLVDRVQKTRDLIPFEEILEKKKQRIRSLRDELFKSKPSASGDFSQLFDRRGFTGIYDYDENLGHKVLAYHDFIKSFDPANDLEALIPLGLFPPQTSAPVSKRGNIAPINISKAIPARSGYFPPTHNKQFGIRVAGGKTGRAFLFSDKNSDLFKAHRENMQYLWDHRGKFSVFDFFSPTPIDWELIWDTLEIDHQVGRSQLIGAFKSYTQSSEYPSFLKLMIKSLDLSRDPVANDSISPGYYTATWWDRSLWPYLVGEKNPEVKEIPGLSEKAKENLGDNFLTTRDSNIQSLRAQKEIFQYYLKQEYAKQLGDNYPTSINELNNVYLTVNQKVFAQQRSPHEYTRIAFLSSTKEMLLIELLKGKKASLDHKEKLLKKIFLDFPRDESNEIKFSGLIKDPPWSWLFESSRSDSLKVFQFLKENGLFSSYLDLYSQISTDKTFLDYIGTYQRVYFRSLSLNARSIIDAIHHDPKLALKKLPQILDPANGVYDNRGLINPPGVRQIKNELIQASQTLPLSWEQKRNLLRRLTASGPTVDTDRYLISLISEPKLEFKKKRELLDEVLKSQQVHRDSLKLSLAQELLEPEILSLKNSSLKLHTFDEILRRLEEYVPEASLARDDLLEKWAWMSGLRDKYLLGLIESKKSTNWKSIHPAKVRLGSAASTMIPKLGAFDLDLLIHYFLNPDNKPLPDSVKNSLRNIVKIELEDNFDYFKELIKETPISDISQRGKGSVDAATDFIVGTIESFALDSSSSEKIPAFELILTAKQQRSVIDPIDFYRNISRNYLALPTDSDKEKALLTFLRISDEHERSVALSYLLSQSGGDRSSVKAIFEAFQTPGIKFGQLAAIFKVFSDEVTKELLELKDDAKPMSKAEIEIFLKSELSPEEFSKIKNLGEIKGSASIKTVVSAELHDGRKVVFLIQRPNAQELVRTNIEFAKKYIDALEKEGTFKQSKVFRALLEDFEHEMLEELNFKNEAKKIKRSRSIVNQLNRKMKKELKGLTLKSPDLISDFQVRKNLLVVEEVDGLPWKELGAKTKKLVGPSVVKGSLLSLFRFGMSWPDRHTGNLLINTKEKIINLIDFGQAKELVQRPSLLTDDSFKLSQLFQAVDAKNAHQFVNIAEEISRPHQALSDNKKKALISDIQKILNTSDQGDLTESLTSLYGTLLDYDIHPERRFSFSIMKGLLVLGGEDYVSQEEFKQFLGQEVKHTFLKRKLPLTLTQPARSCVQVLVNSLTNTLRK